MTRKELSRIIKRCNYLNKNMSKKSLGICAIILGCIFIIIAIYYWITPAGSLASFIPGFEPGVGTVHFKHGLASFILGLALFTYAWFKGGKK